MQNANAHLHQELLRFAQTCQQYASEREAQQAYTREMFASSSNTIRTHLHAAQNEKAQKLQELRNEFSTIPDLKKMTEH